MPKSTQTEKVSSSITKNNEQEKSRQKKSETKNKENTKKVDKRQQEIKEIIEKERLAQQNKKEQEQKVNEANETKEEKQKAKSKEKGKKEKKEKVGNKLTKVSNQQVQQIEEVEKEIKSNKKLPEEQQNQIHTRVFQNIFLAVIIILYLNFIILGFWNIENSVFVVDLKVFSMSILVIAIGVIEYAYKKDSGRHAIHGIETLVLALATMSFIYLNMMWQEKFVPVVVIVALVFAIYYVAKTIIIYHKMKKQFSIENIKEIIKK